MCDCKCPCGCDFPSNQPGWKPSLTPHKHAALIKAWEDGAEIEYRSTPFDEWSFRSKPVWSEHYEYRIKPVPKPDTSLKVRLFQDEGYVSVFNRNTVVNACCVLMVKQGSLRVFLCWISA